MAIADQVEPARPNEHAEQLRLGSAEGGEVLGVRADPDLAALPRRLQRPRRQLHHRPAVALDDPAQDPPCHCQGELDEVGLGSGEEPVVQERRSRHDLGRSGEALLPPGRDRGRAQGLRFRARLDEELRGLPLPLRSRLPRATSRASRTTAGMRRLPSGQGCSPPDASAVMRHDRMHVTCLRPTARTGARAARIGSRRRHEERRAAVPGAEPRSTNGEGPAAVTGEGPSGLRAAGGGA